jgi:hypothetical protein
MLTALAVVYLQEKHVPEERAALYEAIMQWLGQQAAGRLRVYKKDDVLGWFGDLALKMQQWEGGQKLQIAVETAAEAIADGFPAVPPMKPYHAALRFLEQAQLDSGIITLRGKELEFWHRSFQEYLAARALTTLGDKLLWEKARAFLYSPEGREVLPLAGGRMAELQKHSLHELFEELIREAVKAELGPRAHAVGVLGRMLADLRSTTYRLNAETQARYAGLLDEVFGIFKADKAVSIPRKTRVDAAEALGAAGDPRLRFPCDPDYWVEIKGGASTMGAQKTDKKDKLTYDPEADDDETVRLVELPTFHIGRFPVTVLEYGKYVEEAGAAQPDDWEQQLLHPSRPVVNVTWRAASEYCQWASKKWRIDLPSEEQWEFAARGCQGRRYPWGSEEPTEERANYDMRVGAPTPVGLFPAGSTPDGVADMAGNVLEWTRSKYDKDRMAVRGASFFYDSRWLRAAYRSGNQPVSWLSVVGFRCVRE